MKIKFEKSIFQKIVYPCIAILILNMLLQFSFFFTDVTSFVKSIFLVESILSFLLLLISGFYQKKSEQMGFFFLITFTVKNILVYVFYSSLVSGITQTFSDKLVFILIFLSFIGLDVYFTVVLLKKNELK